MTENEVPHLKKGAFLLAFSRCGSITTAAKEVDIDRGTHYDWMKEAAYRAEFEESQRRAARELEDEAVRRATTGGSDTLLIFLLKCRNPAVFGDRTQLQHTGPDGGALQVTFVPAPAIPRAEVIDVTEVPRLNGHTNGHANGGLTVPWP